MSFLKSLFGGKGGDEGVGGKGAIAKGGASEDYNGFTIRATPMRQGSEHGLAGTIEKEIDGEVKTYSFIRADKFMSHEDAESAALAKGRQLVDEQGDRLFS